MKNLQCFKNSDSFFPKRAVFQTPEGPKDKEDSSTKMPEFKKAADVFDKYKDMTDEDFQKLKDEDVTKLADDAIKANDDLAKDPKYQVDGKTPIEITSKKEAANSEINNKKSEFLYKIKFIKFKTEVSTYDTQKDSKDYQVDADFVFDEKTSPALKENLKKLAEGYQKSLDNNDITAKDRADLKLKASIDELNKRIAIIDKAADVLNITTTVDELTDREITINLDELKAPEQKDPLDAETARANNIYFAQLNTARDERVTLKDELTQLSKTIDANKDLSPAKKTELKQKITDRLKELKIDDEIKKADQRIADLGKEGITVSSDYLKEKLAAEKAILDDLRAASSKAQVARESAVNQYIKSHPGEFNEKDGLPKFQGPDKERAYALGKIDPKLIRDGNDSYTAFKTQLDHYNRLAKVGGNTVGIPDDLDKAWGAVNAGISADEGSKEEKEGADPRLDPDLKDQPNSLAYKKAWARYQDTWYRLAAKLDKPYPPDAAPAKDGEPKVESGVKTADVAKQLDGLKGKEGDITVNGAKIHVTFDSSGYAKVDGASLGLDGNLTNTNEVVAKRLAEIMTEEKAAKVSEDKARGVWEKLPTKWKVSDGNGSEKWPDKDATVANINADNHWNAAMRAKADKNYKLAIQEFGIAEGYYAKIGVAGAKYDAAHPEGAPAAPNDASKEKPDTTADFVKAMVDDAKYDTNGNANISINGVSFTVNKVVGTNQNVLYKTKIGDKEISATDPFTFSGDVAKAVNAEAKKPEQPKTA